MKSILFLGGGQLGIPVIRWAREIGFHIIVNDRNQQSPGLKHADVTINFDSTDVRSLATWVANYDGLFNIRYCHCGSDFGLITAAVIHDILGIPHSPLYAVINGLDKNLMKNCWASNGGINYPMSRIITSEDEICNAGKELGWPLIIKPTSASGSQGVSLANTEKEAILYFQEAAKYSETGHIIAEQFIEGTHHDVNGLFWDGVFYPCGIGDRFFTPFPYCVPHHGYFPSDLGLLKRSKLYCLLEKGARSMGINWGPVKADAVFYGDKAYVYEISPRFHGDVFTSNVMGFLANKNPVYQFLSWMYHGEFSTFVSIENVNGKTIGGWRTIFGQPEKKWLANLNGFFLKRKKKVDVIKNNDEIFGLAWVWGESKKKVNKMLRIEAHG